MARVHELPAFLQVFAPNIKVLSLPWHYGNKVSGRFFLLPDTLLLWGSFLPLWALGTLSCLSETRMLASLMGPSFLRRVFAYFQGKTRQLSNKCSIQHGN
jgi:hypothetical protein